MFPSAGSASRLSRKSSYHHCTLLHSADRSALATMLRPSCPGIHSNATPSVPSPVANLLDHAPTLQWEELLEAVVQQYNAGTCGARPPAGQQVALQQHVHRIDAPDRTVLLILDLVASDRS